MAVNREELISCLNDLIQSCRDGEKGFQLASESVKNAELKALFRRYSLQRAQFATELQSEVRQLGGDAVEGGTVSGSLHRGWLNLKSVVTGNDSAIISECERGEDAAVANYKEVLKQNLPPNVMPVVKHQFTQIKETHDRMRGMQEAA